MKKMLFFAFIMIVTIFMLASCKDKNETTDSETETQTETEIPLFDYMGNDLNEYIDLKGYEGIKMPYDQYILGYNYTLYSEFIGHNHDEDELELSYSEPITDRTIMNGDLVDLDYEGYIDDEKFEGGTATGFKLFIGSNTFIDGFESSLVGRGLDGDTEFSINVKFPETYIHSDYAGKEAEFRVKINSYVEVIYPEITDDLAKHVGYEDAEDYSNAISENIKNSYAFKVINNASTFHKLPEGQVDKYVSDTLQQMSYYASMAGMTLETYSKIYLGYTAQQLYEVVRREGEGYVKGRLIFSSIAKIVGIEATDEEYTAKVNEYIQANPGLTQADVEKAYSKVYIRENIINEKAYLWLANNVTTTEPTA